MNISPAVYRLVMLKHALRLEEKGLKHSGGAIRPRIAKEFGLSPREPRERFIEALQAKLDQLTHEAHTGGKEPNA